MKKILVFGGTQFVGKRLISNLLEKNYDVTVVSRGNWPVPHLNSIKHVKADRYDSSTFGDLVNQEWDVIVDQLAFYGYDAKVLIDAFKGRVKKFVCVTSNAVYESGFKLKESDFDSSLMDVSNIDYSKYREPKIDTPEYQQGKREVEFSYLQSGVPTTLVRFPIIIGPDDLSLRFYNLYKLVSNNEEVKLENFERRQSFINSREAARFLSFCIDNEIEGPVNASLEGEFTLQMLEKILNKKVNYSITNETNTFLEGNEVTLSNDFAKSFGFNFENLETYLKELTLLYGFYRERF
jgi:nucleoside-diphosphate-sugar epimerase